MSAEDNYVVEILDYPPEEKDAIVQALATSFHRPVDEMEVLMQRFPGVATKPMTREYAYLASERFEKAGLNTMVRPLAESTSVATPEAKEASLVTKSKESYSNSQGNEVQPPQQVAVTPTAPLQTPSNAQQPQSQQTRSKNKATSIGSRVSQFFQGIRRDRSSRSRIPAAPSSGATAHKGSTDKGSTENDGSRRNTSDEKRRVSLRTKFLLAVLFPVLLTLLGALAVIALNVAPTLREQLLSTAKAPALTTVERIESLLPSTELANERLDSASSLPVLQETIEGTRRAYREQNIAFIAIADTEGRYQSGWFNRDYTTNLEAVQQDLNEVIIEQTEQAVRLSEEYENIPEDKSPSSELRVPGLGQLEVIAQPIRRSGQTLGAVTVGVNTSLVSQRVSDILRTTIGVTMIPIVIAIIIALIVGRALTRNVVALTNAADRLSRGDLDTTIDVKSNDELGDLSDAFERLRVSLRLAMNRLRRKSRQSN